MTIHDTGVIHASGNLALTTGSTLTLEEVFTVGGTLSGSGHVTGPGVLNVAGGGQLILNAATIDVGTFNEGTIIAQGNTILNGSFTNDVGATTWVRGSAAIGNARLTLNADSTNAGILRIESTEDTWTSELQTGDADLTNDPTGEIAVGNGTGGPRTLNGRFINAGLITVDPEIFLPLSGVYEEAGGSINGAACITNAEIRVTASPAQPVTLVLCGANTLTTGNLANVTLWVQGNDVFGNSMLTVAASATNEGTIRLESVNDTWQSNLEQATGTLTNAAGGRIEANLGSGGPRRFTGNLTNRGTVKVEADSTLDVDGDVPVLRQEQGLIQADGQLAIFGGEFDFIGGGLAGNVHVYNSTINVANSVTAASTVSTSGHSTLISNNSPAVTVWVQGNDRFGNATLNINGPANNAGKIQLESNDDLWNSTIAMSSEGVLTNLAGGVIETNVGSGGARSIAGVVVNQGEMTVEPAAFLTITGQYELAGGRNEGPAYITGSEVRVTDSPDSPTTILLGGANTLTTGNLANVTLWVQGNDVFGNSLLTVVASASNEGTIRLESVSDIWQSDLKQATGTLTNAPGGVIEANLGSGGPRRFTGNLTNRGTVKVETGNNLDVDGDVPLLRQEQGVIQADGQLALVGGEFDFSGGALAGNVHIFNSTINVANSVTAASMLSTSGHSTLISNNSPAVTIWVQGNDRFGNATLNINGPANNAGTIQLESINDLWNSTIAMSSEGVLTNLAGGVMKTNFGSGGARSITGVVVNQGDMTVEPAAFLTITGEYELAGGRNEGPAYITGSEVRVTASPDSPTTILLGGANSLTTGNLPNVMLWVQGNDAFGNSLLSIAASATNEGTIRLESIDQTWTSDLTQATGTLTNAASGVIEVNHGTGGPRSIAAELLNIGTVHFNTSTTLGRDLAEHINTGTIRIANGAIATIIGSALRNGAVDNLLANPSFENPGDLSTVIDHNTGQPLNPSPSSPPDAATPIFVLPPTSQAIENWEVIVGEPGATMDWVHASHLEATDGERLVDLNGTPGPGGIRQTFPTTPGLVYRVQFDLAGNPYGNQLQLNPLKRLEVRAAGQSQEFDFTVAADASPTNVGWVLREWQFTAVDSTTTLEFRSLVAIRDGLSDFGPTIDNVRVFFGDEGKIVGDGTLDVSAIHFTSNGTIRASHSAVPAVDGIASLTITGNAELLELNRVQLEIGGAIPGSEHDQLQITQSVTFSGDLNIAFLDGFNPSVGDSFQVMTYGSHVGAFDRINVVNLPGGKTLSPVYNADNLTLVVAQPLMARELATSDAPAAILSGADGLASLEAAIHRWEEAGLTPDQVARLRGVNLVVTDLSSVGAVLALQSGDTIWIDDDAAGWGWFVDDSPMDDTEFDLSDDGLLRARQHGPAQGHLDLLTALSHELGHVLGLQHTHDVDDLMSESLDVDVRHRPWTELVDAIFAETVL